MAVAFSELASDEAVLLALSEVVSAEEGLVVAVVAVPELVSPEENGVAVVL